MITPIASVKTLGIAAGVLLFAYAFAITKLGRYSNVSDKYAQAFGTVALMLILIATGGFQRPPANFVLEAAGYVVVVLGATIAFVRIVTNQQYFEKA